MSSAALQSALHQSTNVGSHSPVPATSNRPYTAGSSQSRDPYYNQQTSNASPTSTRRPSRRPSGNGASTNNSQQPQYYSPSGSTPTSAVARPSNQSSPTITAAPSGYPTMAPGDHRAGVPPIVSPRTSSNRNPAHAAAATADRNDRSRQAGYTNEATNSPRSVESPHEQRDRHRTNGNTQVNGTERSGDEAVAATRARRRAAHTPESLPHRPSGSREQRSTSATRAQTRHVTSGTGTSSPSGLSREASEVLNRVVVSKPEVDIERERERMAEAVPSSPATQSQATPIGQLSVVGSEGVDDSGRGGSRSRHDHASSSTKRERNIKFGDYYLGNTIGEGEFGKVKMGWKQEGGVQVAVKLIRRDSVGTNPTRLAKIYREIAILREISHPNIVRLHEMVETEKQIGIILEYASGGELFDYILNHRYLKDNAARRLFAQLVSGVGYLHKKGIVHRDLKLENLLLDRNRNIIITDFGFANTFNPDDELGDDIEHNLSSRDYVKRMELDKLLPGGYRRGDLMQTSCGSPCYAAPELVVSDSLYTGRKVDVWSCGVILYAMLAGYLPFDDDPANPEGDNINLLYKYIVSTPLTFPEYVTPHARDLLRRILVPDPRKRADLFEVARHSWLSEYSHVVGFITSSTTTSTDIGRTAIGSVEPEAPLLARSASVREPSKAKSPTTVGDLSRKHGNVDQDAPDSHPKPSKDNKRRTVQVEYVAPKSQTVRGEPSTAPTQASTSARTRARAGSQGPVEVSPQQAAQASSARRVVSKEKPLPQAPTDQYSQGRQPSSSHRQQQTMPPPARPGREPPRSVSDANHISSTAPPVSMPRPATGGSMTSIGSRSGALPSRGSYSQPVAPTVAGTNAHGRIAQPQSGKSYNISAPIPQDEPEYGHISSGQVPAKFARVAGMGESNPPPEKGHKRSNTIGGFFSRSNSVFGGRKNAEPSQEKPKKSYPPVSMSGSMAAGADAPRPSMDSRRSISFGFAKKRSGSIAGSQTTTLQDKPRRFSLLPTSFSLKSIGIGKDNGTPGAPSSEHGSRPDSRGNYLDPPNPEFSQQQHQARNVSGNTPYSADGAYERRDSPQSRRGTSTASPPTHQRYKSQQLTDPRSNAPPPQFLPPLNFREQQSAPPTESESSLPRAQYPPGFNDYDDHRQPSSGGARVNSSGRGVLTKNNRKFTDAYEVGDQGNGWGPAHAHTDHAGSSGAARKVMDFFRRRGKDRGDGR